MKNFQITSIENGQKYWISRSIAVHGMIILHSGEDQYLLLIKRGPGCPDEIGKWANISGYLDWDETLLEGLYREVWEESGLDISSLKNVKVRENGISDEVTGENRIKQNVTIRYIIDLDYSEVLPLFKSGIINTDTVSRGGEPGEVSDLRFLHLTKDGVDPKEFAFNHGELINKYINDSTSYRK